ncbi:ASCH domain-containing protein [Tabrizicola sp. TH137]|uniref:ASCH domain-containing protein n=1 Tax=Tabrizicola sp. TH137 TaxID=2067452 RepID=UPI000C7DA082|nr:ASCH domain-containing protein [Tabrizicola sp. TH137]PLL13136.1 ASCH domain-containing protein [Tabrizicola sp. TH137]
MDEQTVVVEGFGRLPCLSFGSEGMHARLAALVIAGRKRATVWDGREENPTEPGMRWAVMADGRAVAVIETVAVGRRRYDQIDEAFAALEGEGDGSLAFWQAAHEDYFRKAGVFAPDMWLWWEEFRLVAVIDAELAAAAAEHVAAEEAEARALLAARA